MVFFFFFKNYTKDNKSQGTMEKSQWDLKNIRFQHKRITRLDDFVNTYKVMHAGLLREYEDNLKLKTTNKVIQLCHLTLLNARNTYDCNL